MDCVSIIRSVERLGAEMLPDGKHIRIKNGSRLPGPLIEEIKGRKQEILTILERDKLAKGAGLLVAISGELYTVTINSRTSVYIELTDGIWEAWRETYIPGQKQATSTKTIATGSKLKYILPQVKRYLNFFKGR